MRLGKDGVDVKGVSVSSAFWRGRRVLLTGHTGFKGSWLSLWLQSMKAIVRGLALEPYTFPDLFSVGKVAKGMDHSLCDVRDFSLLSDNILSFKPEILIHLAAQPLVRVSYDRPIETYSTNVMGTAHVLEAARKCKSVRVVIVVTTDKCYENKEWVWGYREDERMGGYDPYSSSKGCAELLTSAYRRSFLNNEGIAVATARAGNVIGGGDWSKDRLIPDVLRSLGSKIPVMLRRPSAIRPWQHVLEPLSGYLILAERLFNDGQPFAEGWNFGPEEEDSKSVQWVVNFLCEHWGENSKWACEEEASLHEAHYLKLDISKAKQRLSWSPRWSLETALLKVIHWHKAWQRGEDMRKICLEQISEYGFD